MLQNNKVGLGIFVKPTCGVSLTHIDVGVLSIEAEIDRNRYRYIDLKIKNLKGDGTLVIGLVDISQ